MDKKPNEELTVPTRRQANRVARMIGCQGSHQTEDGQWMPCASHSELLDIIEPKSKTVEYGVKRRKRKGKRRQNGYEELLERGVVGIDTLEGGGLVSAQVGVKAMRKARKNRLAATPALPKERIRGSRRNAIGSAASVSAGRSVTIDDATQKSLAGKVKEHNERMKGKEAWRRASLGQLKAVYRRGAGAFSVSHRPGMTRNQWAMGRVNAFLKILSSGKPDNRRYVGDNDLLPKGHPWKRTISTKSLHVKRLRIGRFFKRRPDSEGFDGDNDGRIFDGTPEERPAPFRRVTEAVRTRLSNRGPLAKLRQRRKRKEHEKLDLGGIFNRVNDPDGGFTFKMTTSTDAKTGWAIARNGQGIAVPASTIWDRDGKPTEEGKRLLLAFVDRHQSELLGDDDPNSGKSVHLGGWHNPKTGMVHFDVTDVYDKKKFSEEEAIAIGKRERQISIADLDEITAALADDDWENHKTTVDTGGDGGEIIDLEDLEPELRQLDEMYGPMNRRSLMERVEEGPENVAMQLAEPVKELGDKHGVQKDWHGVVALKPEMRQEIADFYNAADEVSSEQASEEVKRAYKALTDEIEEQYRMLTEELDIEIEFVDDDPYEDFFAMRKDFVENRRMKIMRTAVTGSHPLMTDDQNDKFRAVHDAFGHLATGRGFDRHGEEAAYQAHSTMFSGEAKKALATETRGQNNTLITNGDFPPQKLVILPEGLIKSLFIMASLMFKAYKDLRKKSQVDSDLDNAYTSTQSHHVSGGRVIRPTSD